MTGASLLSQETFQDLLTRQLKGKKQHWNPGLRHPGCDIESEARLAHTTPGPHQGESAGTESSCVLVNGLKARIDARTEFGRAVYESFHINLLL